MAYDVAVIGGGPGGYVAALRAAQEGLRVVVIEQGAVGGTCLNRGCIPTKALNASAAAVALVKSAADLGVRVTGVEPDFRRMMERKDQVVEGLVKGIEFLFQRRGVELLRGRGRLAGSGRVAVALADGGSEEVLAKNVILATGSEPALIKALGYDGVRVLTSTEALALNEVPESLLIIGGGVVGCEFACIFNALGCQVTIVEVMPNILPLLDKEVARKMQSLLKGQGITIKTKTKIEAVANAPDGVVATLEGGEEVRAAKGLISIGRRLNTADLGLEEVGVALGERGEVLVDQYLRTKAAGVYAVGDITNKVQLAHVASAQGLAAVDHILGRERAMDYQVIPSCIFTFPEVGSVGLSSEQVKERGLKARTGKFPLIASGKARAMGETEGFVKVIAEEESDRLLGVHVVGPHATDLIAEAALALQVGATARQLAETIHAHPTLAEGLMEAAEAVHGRSIHA